jgi:hypothetical protein
MKEAVRVLISRGIYTGRSGNPEQALLILTRALVFAAENKVDDPNLNFITLHNILQFRVERGEFHEASRQLFDMRPLYVRYAGAVDALKLRGIEGQIAAGVGEDERAESIFLEIREEFGQRGQVFQAANVGLELAAIWLRQGRMPEAQQVVSEILEVFRSRHVSQETINALQVLLNALERDLATRELILRVAALVVAQQDEAVNGQI